MKLKENVNLDNSSSTKTGQTRSADEAHVIRSKAPEHLRNGEVLPISVVQVGRLGRTYFVLAAPLCEPSAVMAEQRPSCAVQARV